LSPLKNRTIREKRAGDATKERLEKLGEGRKEMEIDKTITEREGAPLTILSLASRSDNVAQMNIIFHRLSFGIVGGLMASES
jgi:hypothetical protein